MELLPPRFWHARSSGARTVAALLWPGSVLYRSVARVDRWHGLRIARRTSPFGVPIVVVGNLSVGGSGKTPLVLWLAMQLQTVGWRPGIVSRGYGRVSSVARSVQSVLPESTVAEVGDEALLLARRSGCPVVIGADRVAAVRLLLRADAKEGKVNIVLSDDGLQHYRLPRDVEIVVVDGARGFGNGLCLPAGPLRESPRRLREADFVIVHATGDGNNTCDDTFPNKRAVNNYINNDAGDAISDARNKAGDKNCHHSFYLHTESLVNVADHTKRLSPDAFAGEYVHAVAGIGYPRRFFDALATLGMKVEAHAFADHHLYRARELCFSDDAPLVMTEKDAVKCETIVQPPPPHWWYLQVSAVPMHNTAHALMQLIQTLR